jgi:hypothetical protein
MLDLEVYGFGTISLVPAQIKEVMYLFDVLSVYISNVHVASSVLFTPFSNTPNDSRMCKLMIFLFPRR